LDRDYDKANKAFDNAKQLENIKLARKFSIEFLKLVDETNQYINNCKDYDCKQLDSNMFNTVYGSFQMQGGFSKSFTKKVYNEYISTIKKANKLNKLIVQTYNRNLLAKQKQQVSDQKAHEIQREKDDVASEKAYQQEQIEKAKQKTCRQLIESQWSEDTEYGKKKKQRCIAEAKKADNAIDLKAKQLGYKKFTTLGVTSVMYHTQNGEHLEDYINTVLGCSQLRMTNCNDLNSNLRVSQVLDDIVIYNYFEDMGNGILDYSIATKKERGRIYQENQRFDNDFYVFSGMFSYTTILGVKRSIPYLKKVKLQ
jgi:hypothetical protein